MQQLALVQWKLCGLSSAQGQTQKLTSAILQQLQDRRRGGAIDSGLVKQVISSLLAIGMDNRPNIAYDGDIDLGDPLAVYTEHFESPFITATKRFYASEVEGYVSTGNLSGYLKHLENCVRAEEYWVQRCMNMTTRKAVRQ